MEIVLDMPSPLHLCRMAYAYSWTSNGEGRWEHAVRGNPDSTISRDQVGAVQRFVHAHCLPQPPRTGGQITLPHWMPARFAHQVHTVQGLDGAYQHTVAFAFLATHCVCAPMYPVRQVDIQVASHAEHRCVPGGSPTKSMGRRIFATRIRFHFDDAPDASVFAYQQLVQ